MKKISLSKNQKKIATIIAIIALPSVLVAGFFVVKKIHQKRKNKRNDEVENESNIIENKDDEFKS